MKFSDKNKEMIFKAGAFVTILWLACWVLNYIFLKHPDNAGTFGDMFGSVNALFSGLAFAGVIIAIILQSEELQLQRDELRETREEFKIQNETLKLQRFENTFFQMLKIHSDIVMTIKFGDKVGRECFGSMYGFYFGGWTPTHDSLPEIMNTYSRLYSSNNSELGHYFRTLYNIIKFIDRSDIEDKKTYSNLVRAQLSTSELKLLAINCLSEHGRDKFKPRIEKYALLSNLSRVEIFSSVFEAYNSSAFA